MKPRDWAGLARAGLALAHAAGARLTGFECAYARLLLASDVVSPTLDFGRSGQVHQDKVNGKPGLGLELTASI